MFPKHLFIICQHNDNDDWVPLSVELGSALTSAIENVKEYPYGVYYVMESTATKVIGLWSIHYYGNVTFIDQEY